MSQDWGTQRPAIMKKNGWDTTPSEVLIRYATLNTASNLARLTKRGCVHSTPRRFGKTFSIGIFAACLALTMKCEIGALSAPCTIVMCRVPCMKGLAAPHKPTQSMGLSSCVAVVFSPARRASRKLLERMVEVRVPKQLHVDTLLTRFCTRSSYACWGTSPSNIIRNSAASRATTGATP